MTALVTILASIMRELERQRGETYAYMNGPARACLIDGEVNLEQLAAAIDRDLSAVYPPLKWSSERPTEPGFYWRRSHAGIQLSHVGADGGASWIGPPSSNSLYDSFDVQWAGPIKPPES